MNRPHRSFSACRRAARPAFSLIELMLAMVILGLGLLMIGAVLPIAWKSSVRLADQTQADAATSAARQTVQALCRVDGPRDLFDGSTDYNPLTPPDNCPDSGACSGVCDSDSDGLCDRISYSFLGDFDTLDFVDVDANEVPDIDAAGNPIVVPRVHVLHVENWAVQGNSNFLSPNAPANDFSVAEAPRLIEFYPPTLADPRLVGIPADIAPLLGFPAPSVIGAPVVRLHNRVFPPISEALTPQDGQWFEALDDRLFAWAVLHRLITVPRSPTDSRFFAMYFVTLKRGSSAERFARQDQTSLPLGVQGSGNSPPRALGSQDDVAFPIAWRVPLVIIEARNPQAQTPSIAIAGALDQGALEAVLPSLTPGVAQPFLVNNTNAPIAAMFPPGAFLVDELSGTIYRVTARDYITEDTARLTLDQPVRVADLEPTNTTIPPVLGFATSRNRVVWVYPPAVANVARGIGQPVRFTGANPVVDIRLENIRFQP